MSSKTEKNLLDYVQTHANAQGYAVSILRSEKIRKTATLKCDLGGTYRDRGKKGNRETGTRLTDCPFELRLKGNEKGWEFSVTRPSHNHGPWSSPIGHPKALTLSDHQKDSIQSLMHAGVSATKTALSLSDSFLEKKRISNERAKIRKLE
jgi:malonate-semialdehyde dehydrogenase (acetylating)/methylmalonate-semialdehyde dehydrogenase